jgi:antitoxin ParD1/3/4
MVGSQHRRDYVQPMTQLTVSMPPALQRWIDARLAEGHYADAGAYLLDLIRRDQRGAEEDRRIRALVEEGFASGVLDAEPEDVLEEIMARLPDA